MKRFLVLMLAMALALCSLTACGDKADGSGEESGGADSTSVNAETFGGDSIESENPNEQFICIINDSRAVTNIGNTVSIPGSWLEIIGNGKYVFYQKDSALFYKGLVGDPIKVIDNVDKGWKKYECGSDGSIVVFCNDGIYYAADFKTSPQKISDHTNGVRWISISNDCRYVAYVDFEDDIYLLSVNEPYSDKKIIDDEDFGSEVVCVSNTCIYSGNKMWNGSEVISLENKFKEKYYGNHGYMLRNYSVFDGYASTDAVLSTGNKYYATEYNDAIRLYEVTADGLANEQYVCDAKEVKTIRSVDDTGTVAVLLKNKKLGVYYNGTYVEIEAEFKCGGGSSSNPDNNCIGGNVYYDLNGDLYKYNAQTKESSLIASGVKLWVIENNYCFYKVDNLVYMEGVSKPIYEESAEWPIYADDFVSYYYY